MGPRDGDALLAVAEPVTAGPSELRVIVNWFSTLREKFRAK